MIIAALVSNHFSGWCEGEISEDLKALRENKRPYGKGYRVIEYDKQAG
jgi:hypothetical protein